MKKTWVLLISGVLFLSGQIVMIGLQNLALGGFLSSLAVVVALIQVTNSLGINASLILAAAALLSAGAAQVVVRTAPLLGLGLFILSGLLLLLCKTENAEWTKSDRLIPAHSQPLQSWEPWFFVFLVVLSVVIRVAHFNGFPFGAIPEEAQHFPVIEGAVAGGTYIPHFTHGNMGIPTLLSYLAYYSSQLFGRNVDSFRLPMELFGVFSVMAFYFTARRISSPVTAAVTSLMYTAWFLQIGFSRRFYPYIIILIPVVLGFGLMLVGMAQRKAHWFLLAGMAVGLSFFGYEAGRGAFLIFLFWMLWLAFFYRSLLPPLKYLMLFWVGFTIVITPIIYHSFINWDNYWHYVASKNPNRGQGVLGYINQIKALIPSYAQVFHVKSDSNYTMYITYRPILDPVMGMLFGMGIFFCLGRFWQPVPAFILAFFVAGMMPGLIGGGEEHPTARRIVLCYPAIFLLATLALEKVRRILEKPWTWLRTVTVIVMFAAALISAGMNLYYYYYQWADSPEARTGFCYRAQKIVDDVKKYPEAVVRVQDSLMHEQLWVLGVDGLNPEHFPYFEDYLLMDRTRDYLLFFEGYMEPALPLIQRCFPHAQIEVYREKYPNRLFCTSWAYLKLGTDPNNPEVYLIRVFIPQSDVAAFQSLVDLSQTGAARIELSAASLNQDITRKPLHWGGALLTSRQGEYEFQLPGIGGRLWVNGQPQEFNKPLQLPEGIAYFEIKSELPSQLLGAPLLRIMQGKLDQARLGRVVALLPTQGMRYVGRKAMNQWEGPKELERQELLPFKRFYYDAAMWIASAQFDAGLQVPVTGDYTFWIKPYSFCRVQVAGQEAFTNFQNVETRQIVHLIAGQTVLLHADYKVQGELIITTFQLYYQRSGEQTSSAVPAEWFHLPWLEQAK